MSEQIRYRFGPLERRGLLLGMTATQLTLLLVSAGVALFLLHIATNVVTIFFAFFLVGMAGFACFWPVSDGRTLSAALPLAVSWMYRQVRGRNRWVSAAPLVGRTRAAEHTLDLPPTMTGISILAAPVSGGELGVIKDSRDRTYTAVVSVRGRSFALLDQDAKARLLSQWADVMAGLAREHSPIKRLQWLERTVPDPGDGIGQYLREAIALPHTSTAVRSYLQLIEDAGPATQNHETFVVVQIDAERAMRSIRQAGGGDDGACATLAREIYGLASRLQAAELDVVGLLTPRLLAQSIRISIDPASRNAIAMRNVTQPESAGVSAAEAWPTATDTAWSHYRTDSAFHVTYWVSEWPRSDVGPDFIAPLLLQTWVHRTVSVTMEAVPPLKAQREVEAARTTDAADADFRTRHGFMTTMRKQREQESVMRREQELADGHADIRFSGYVTVSAPDIDTLDISCQEVEQAAGQSRMMLRRLSGDQDLAFTYTLPLGRGLR